MYWALTCKPPAHDWPAKLQILKKSSGPAVGDELVDVIGYDGGSTGQVISRKEAHRQGLPHWIVGIFVFNDDGKLIVQNHKNADYRLDHSVGGHIAHGQTQTEAANTELKEELGISAKLRFIGSALHGKEHYDSYDPRIRHGFKVFTAKTPAGWKFVPNDEVVKITEMELDEVVELMNSSPEKFVTGFFTTMSVYLKSIDSDKKIIALGKDWGSYGE